MNAPTVKNLILNVFLCTTAYILFKLSINKTSKLMKNRLSKCFHNSEVPLQCNVYSCNTAVIEMATPTIAAETHLLLLSLVCLSDIFLLKLILVNNGIQWVPLNVIPL